MKPSSLSSSYSSRLLEIMVISGENLLDNRKQSVKKNTFVNVKAEFSTCNIQTTKMDKEGGCFPTWNEKLIVDMPMHARHLTMKVHCKTSSGIKTIGIAKIPTSDFIGGFFPENYLHFLSYRLRDEKGEKNGIINFSLRVKNTPPLSSQSAGCAAAYSQQWKPPAAGTVSTYGVVTGCAAAYSQQWKAPAAGTVSTYGVVTGMPVYPGSLPNSITDLMVNKF